MRETAWGVCVVLYPVGQEPAADVSPSLTEVMIIKKVQKSLISGWMFCFWHPLEGLSTLIRSSFQKVLVIFPDLIFKMHCIVFTEDKCLPRYVYFCCASVCVLRLQHPLWGGRNCCAAMAAWRKLNWLRQLNLSVVTVGLSPSLWGHGFFHGYSGQDGLLSSHSLASCLMRGEQTSEIPVLNLTFCGLVLPSLVQRETQSLWRY